MGGLLTRPITNKRADQGEGLGLKYGLSSMQGWRSEMEDAHDVKIGLRYGLDEWSFFAVFDGHAGKRAASFAARNLVDFILKDSQFELEIDSTSLDQEYIEPDVERLNDLRVENSFKNQSPEVTTQSYQANPPIVDNERKEAERVNEGEETPKCEKSNQANSANQASTIQDVGTVTKKIDELNSDDGSQQGEQTEGSLFQKKPKFVSQPVLKQLDMVRSAIKSGFLRIDEQMRNTAQDASGCTAVCALISPTHLFIANCGDSRAVLYDGISPKFVTEDHKPFNPKEKRRIIDAGGCVTQRINGTLAVSRALGDFEFKKDNQRGPCEQLVSPEPEVTIIERHPQDEFLILACDGIWDVMTNDDICEFVRYMLKVEPDLKNICSYVLDVCLHKGSRDNMSIIIVVFENGPKFSEEEQKRDKAKEEKLVVIANEVAQNIIDSVTDTVTDLDTFMCCVNQALSQNPNEILPPGAGVEAKHDLLEKIYEKVFNLEQEKEGEDASSP